MFYTGFFVGALIITWALSRIVRRLFLKEATAWKRAIAPNLAALGVATVIGGFGFADGGSPEFLSAFLRYLPPVGVWLALDAWKASRSGPPGPA